MRVWKSPNGNPYALQAASDGLWAGEQITGLDPHGMTFWDGGLWYCSAGIAPGHIQSETKYTGWICRIEI